MLKKVTENVTKKLQKQQISSAIANKYVESLNIIYEILDDNNDIKALINLMLTIKKTNPSLVIYYWGNYVSIHTVLQNQFSNKTINLEFWRDTNFEDIFLKSPNYNKWDDIGNNAVKTLQYMMKQNNNLEFKKKIEKILMNGFELNKMVLLYNNL